MLVEEHPNATAKDPIHIEDGQWFTIMKDGNKPGLWGCCDCGLMHRVEFELHGDTIFVRVYRDNEATKIRRDAMVDES